MECPVAVRIGSHHSGARFYDNNNFFDSECDYTELAAILDQVPESLY
jgi:hypothetical protein